MTRLQETIETRLPIDEAFAFVADFANNAAWDPNSESSERIDAGPIGVGARYKLAVKMRGGVTPMEYRVTTWEPGSRVVLEGSGANIAAIDDIRFAPSGTGTRIDYLADIRLTGWMRLVEPLAGGAIQKIVKDAAARMHQVLEERAGAAAR